MANNKRSKKTNTNSKNKKQTAKSNVKVNRQFSAIILFAIALFLLCIAIIEAGGLWGVLRTFLFGMFGFSAFIFPLLLLVVAIFLTLNKTDGKYTTKLIEVTLIITTICCIWHIITCDSGADFFTAIEESFNTYNIDKRVLGSGVIGAFFGEILLLLTGGSKIASLVIAFILLFVLVMFTSNITLECLLRGISKPVKKIGEATGEKLAEYGEKIEHQQEIKAQKKKEFVADIDLGPDPIENAERIPLFDEEIPEDDLVSFSDATGKNIDIALEEDIETEVEEEKVINLNDIIKKNVAQPETVEEKVEETKNNESEDDWDKEVTKPYILPSIDCLNLPKNSNAANFEAERKMNAEKLTNTLRSFGVETKIVGISQGPSVTRYEIQPAAGVKISKITNLADDIALNLAASGVRIEAPIPNKAAVGIEVPNKNRRMVSMREVIDQPQYKEAKSKLTVALGKDITGEFVYSDLVKMPHLLIAGTTGSGKSVCLNSMIVSILYNATPDEVKLLMIDPKQVEFTIYNGIPHLLVPVVSDPRKASGALSWAVGEMLSRYKTFSEHSVRDISGYNSICESEGKKKMHQIVIFIDELSDLMMAAPNEVEDSICRLAQMARAAGMHLVIATQRPSVDVITGIIKANIPSRISLSVSSQVDSRTIIDSVGAEKLLGNGDMLYYPVGIPKPIRVQGCYLSDKEVENVVNFIKKQEQSSYDDNVIKEIDKNAANSGSKKKDTATSDDGEAGPADEMLPKAIEVVVESQSASTTLLQRKLKLGYARAARIIDDLEERGIIGPYEGAKPRKVLISKQQWLEMNALAHSGADRSYDENESDEQNFE